jgi:DNA-binding response OmpR family regulator
MRDFRVKPIRFSNAERYHILIDLKTGMPCYYTTLYITKRLRNASNAAKTIELTLRHLSILFLFLKNQEKPISLEHRVEEGKLFYEYEIEQIATYCKMKTLSIRDKIMFHKKKQIQNYGSI